MLGLVLVGCSDAPVPAADRHAAAIQALQEDPPSDFLAGVVADGEITAAEYDESVDRYLACVNAAFPTLDPPPATVERAPDGLVLGFTFSGPDEVVTSAEADEVQRTCNEANVGEVGLLYEEMTTTP